MSELPRLLLLSNEPPHTGAAGAIVFHRLLRDFPPDHLLVVSNQRPPKQAGRLDCRYEYVPLAVDRLNRTRFWNWKATLRSLGGPDWIPLSRIDSALRGFRPQVVVTLMQDSWYYDFAARYARKHRMPLCLFVHDLPQGFEPVPSWLRRRQLARDRSVYRLAASRLCISRPMAQYFEREFGVPGEVLLPPRAPKPLAQQPSRCATLKVAGRLTLGYAGGLHYGYGEQLLHMLPALRETGTRVEVFGARPAGVVHSLAEAPDVFTFHGLAPQPEDAWRGLLARCDAVLQPYLDPPGPHASQYQTHFPSKLGDALSLGLPLLITGPTDASGVAWCRENGDCGFWAPSGPELAQTLRQLREDPALRIGVAERGQAAAKAFSAPLLRSRFQAMLAAMAPE